MSIKKENNKLFAYCNVCGFSTEITKNKKERVTGLTPSEIREETAVKQGIIKERPAKKVSIDEDTIKEALELLSSSESD